MLIEGIHFNRQLPSRSIGRKAIGCSISDIAAMGGIPKYALVSLGVPSGLKLQFVRDVYKGMYQLAKTFSVDIIGGDTVKSNRITINVAMVGEAKKHDIVYRKGARIGDQIFVTGRLGKSLSSRYHVRFTPRIK